MDTKTVVGAFLSVALTSSLAGAVPHFTTSSAWTRGSTTVDTPAGRPVDGAQTPAPQGPTVELMAPVAVDCDGGHCANDSTHSEKTSLMPGGKALNANEICYVVLPLQAGWKCYDELSQVQLGDLVEISYNGKSVWGVAGDKGPADSNKFGEASQACLTQLGVDTKGGSNGIGSQALFKFHPGSAGGQKPGSGEEIKSRLASLSSQQGPQGAQLQQASGSAKPFSQCTGGGAKTQEASAKPSTKSA